MAKGKKTVEEWKKELEGLAEECNIDGLHFGFDNGMERFLKQAQLFYADYPENPYSQFFIGVAHAKEKNPEKAIFHLEKALQLGLKSHLQYFFLGSEKYFSQQDSDEGIANISKSIELQPKYSVAMLSLATIYHDLNEFEQCIKWCEKIHQIGDVYSTMASNLSAMVAFNNKQYQEAVVHLRQVVYSKNTPLLSELLVSTAYILLGHCYLLLEEYIQAIDTFTISSRFKKIEADSFHFRGVCKLHLKNFDEAEIDIKRAIKLDPKKDIYKTTLIQVRAERALKSSLRKSEKEKEEDSNKFFITRTPRYCCALL